MTKRILIFLLLFFAAGSCLGGSIRIKRRNGSWFRLQRFGKPCRALIEHRCAEKLLVKVVETTEVLSPSKFARAIPNRFKPISNSLPRLQGAKLYPAGRLPLRAFGPAAAEETVVPPLLGSVGRMKGRPSDHGFGCRDGNSMPSAAVGRFPAQTSRKSGKWCKRPCGWKRATRPALGKTGFLSSWVIRVECLGSTKVSTTGSFKMPVWIG